MPVLRDEIALPLSRGLLLAEDERAHQLIARAALERAGFAVTVVGDGFTALQVAPKLHPDVILLVVLHLDWVMPDLDGVSTCRQLKADVSTADISVIFLTAMAQRREVDAGLAIGAIGHLIKPFDVNTLGKQVYKLLSRPESVHCFQRAGNSVRADPRTSRYQVVRLRTSRYPSRSIAPSALGRQLRRVSQLTLRCAADGASRLGAGAGPPERGSRPRRGPRGSAARGQAILGGASARLFG